MLKKNKTVNRDLLLAQLHGMNVSIQQKKNNKHGNVILVYENGRPYTANILKDAFKKLE